MEFVRNILLQTVQRVRKKENAIIIFLYSYRATPAAIVVEIGIPL